MWHLHLFNFPFISLIKMCVWVGVYELCDRLLLVSYPISILSLFLTNRTSKVFKKAVCPTKKTTLLS